MSKKSIDEIVVEERRTLLCAGGLGALGLLMSGLWTRESAAADVQYNKADVARVNKKLRGSAKERRAFYANPQEYLKRYNIHLTPDMIPSREEVEASLKAKPGKVMLAVPGPQNGRAMSVILSLTSTGGSNTPTQVAPVKKMK